MKKHKKFWFGNLLLFLWLFPVILHAQVTLVPGDDLSICDIFVVMENLFTLLLLTTSGAVALSLVIGGAMMMMSGGNASMMSKGMGLVKIALAGLVAVAASFIILTTILTVFGVQGAFGSLVSFSETSMEVICNQSGAIAPK